MEIVNTMNNPSDNLKDRVKTETITAMRAQDKARLAVIRLLSSEIKQREVDNRIDLDNIGILAVIDKMLAQRKDSYEQFTAANRADLAEQELYEINVLKEFLPAQLSSEEVNELITNSIKSLSATSIRDMGKVMADLKPKIQGRADVAEVSKIIKDLLS